MTKKELRKLSRADLLEMLINQSEELQAVRERLATAEAALQNRELAIHEAGSIAEASLRLNGVFEAAEAAGQQYLDSLRRRSEQQQSVCARLEQESREEAERLRAETEQKCAEMERQTKAQCEAMLRKAETESQACWEVLSEKLETFCRDEEELREILPIVLSKRPQER